MARSVDKSDVISSLGLKRKRSNGLCDCSEFTVDSVWISKFVKQSSFAMVYMTHDGHDRWSLLESGSVLIDELKFSLNLNTNKFDQTLVKLLKFIHYVHL